MPRAIFNKVVARVPITLSSSSIALAFDRALDQTATQERQSLSGAPTQRLPSGCHTSPVAEGSYQVGASSRGELCPASRVHLARASQLPAESGRRHESLRCGLERRVLFEQLPGRGAAAPSPP